MIFVDFDALESLLNNHAKDGEGQRHHPLNFSSEILSKN